MLINVQFNLREQEKMQIVFLNTRHTVYAISIDCIICNQWSAEYETSQFN